MICGARTLLAAILTATLLFGAGITLLWTRPVWAAFPGNNGKIAFTSMRDGNQEIYVMNADGSDQRNLTNDEAHDRNPAWSPDGSKIAFSRLEPSKSDDILTMNSDGSGVTQLTNNHVDDRWPSWSPDGQEIAFTSNRDGDYEIFVMKADGTEVTQLTKNTTFDACPKWSPDGSKIVFHTCSETRCDIFMMNADGSNIAKLLTEDGGYLPDWSPDGSRIAFDGFHGIFVMHADGSDSRQVGTSDATEPAWSPDGLKIVFTIDYRDVYVMNGDGSGQVNLTNDGTDNREPDWQPVERIVKTSSAQTETEQPLSIQTQPEAAKSVAWPLSGSWALVLAALVVLATVAYVVGRRTQQSVSAAKVAPVALFEVSASVPSVGKTVTLEVAPDHTVGSLVETLTSTLDLPKGRAYAVEYEGRLISRAESGKTLATFGIKEGSKLSLRVVD